MIGRILYLKNNHIPPIKTDLKSDYLSFGSYDGLSVSRNVLDDNKSDLLKIWFESVKDTFEMKGGYSSQAMYLFSDADNGADEAFWSNSDYSILFLITIQLNARDNYLEKISKEIEKHIKKFCENMQIPAIVTSYLMLDENDILLAIKCNNYKLGKIVTSSLHRKDNGIVILENIYYVSYSFTITGIKETEQGANIDGLPDYCHIQLVERYPGAIKDISNTSKLKDATDIENYPIFGRDDEILRFKPKSWPGILSLYRDGGPFYNDDDYRNRLLSVSTRFLCEVEEKIIFGNGKITSGAMNEEERKDTICNQLRKRIERLYENNINKLSENNGHALLYNSCACYKAIWQILNSIEKFESKVFPDYIYISIFAPLTMLIEKIVEKVDVDIQNSMLNIGYLENIKEIYSFLAAINQISQNLIRAERQFMQIPELNANCYNIPIKLHTFYAAFVDNVKNYLNKYFGTGNRYEFTLYPGMNEQLNVRRVFYSSLDNKRLLLMKIPEKQVFDLNHLMICLCHEVGHFVGSSLRQRKKRYETIKMALARMICLHAYVNKEIKRFITKTGLDYLCNFTYKDIVQCIDMQKKKVDKVEEQGFDTILHSENLKPILIQGINFFIADTMRYNNDDFDFIFVRYMEEKYESGINCDDIEKMKEAYDDSVRSYFFAIQSNMNLEGSSISVENMVARLISLTKESFADLISVLILDLEFKDYCQSIFKSLSEYEIKDISTSDLVIRVTLVAVAMTVELEDEENNMCYEKRWNSNEIVIWKNEETNQNIKTFLDKVWEYLYYAGKDYIDRDLEFDQPDSVFKRLENIDADTVLSVFRDYELLNYLYTYLCSCRLFFEKNITQDSEAERIKIKNCFKKLTGEDKILAKVNCINAINDEYDILTRNRVQKLLSNIKN